MKNRKLKKLLKEESRKLAVANRNIFEQMAEIHAQNRINEILEQVIQTAEKEMYRKEVIIGYLEIKLLEAIQNE